MVKIYLQLHLKYLQNRTFFYLYMSSKQIYPKKSFKFQNRVEVDFEI